MSSVPLLPLKRNFETEGVLRKLVQAHRALAELKGVAEIIPNQNILISTLSLQEAKDSSAIENIVTSYDELYKSALCIKSFSSRSAKEVYNYAAALRSGYEQVKKSSLLTNRHIHDIHSVLEECNTGFRALPGTQLKNDQTGKVVYTPPQSASEIHTLMHNLEQYINDDSLCANDPLIKMAILHHQFVSIHPFYDGNGRTGRIINVLYLVKKGLLHTPVLYISRYINEHKNEYYQLLQAVRENEAAWEKWIYFILEAITQTAYQTIQLIYDMKSLMQKQKHLIRTQLPKMYSHDLLSIIFSYPYTKTAFIQKELGKSKVTALRYLDGLHTIGLMKKVKKGRDVYFINSQLFDLLDGVKSSNE